MRKRMMLYFDAARGWHVDLPTYQMVNDTFDPVTAGLIHANGVFPGAPVAEVLALGPSVEVELPDDTPTTKAGKIDTAALRKMYADHPRFGDASYRAPNEK